MNRAKMSMGLVPLPQHHLSQGEFKTKDKRRAAGSISEASIPKDLIFKGKVVPNYMNFAGPGDYETHNKV